MSHTLIQVGNSNAIIIPARIIKKRKYTLKTEFDIIETSDGIKLVHKPQTLDSIEFPKVPRPVISDEIKALNSVVRFSEEEIENDERLQYILSR